VSVAHDIYAETNPAFGAYALVAFTRAFSSINNEGPEVPTAYLSLPVALSADLGQAFKGTNKNTGLFEWLERSPEVQVKLAERIDGTMGIVTEAIRFGCFTRVLRLKEDARLALGDRKLKTSSVTRLSHEPSEVIKRAERLGYWFATTGSTRAVFDMMGLTV
jgi:Family of unknown function (DUF6521)